MILGKETFQDAWNSDYMKDIRRKMIDGKSVEGCGTCYKQEKIGKKSYRQIHNQEWTSRLSKKYIRKIVDKSIESNFEVHQMPSYLDLRLGNLCNLKCRMCNPYNSVQIYNEWKRLDQKTDDKYSEFWKKYQLYLNSCDTWYESETFWNSVEDHIPYLEKVYMTGGEPTLIKGNERFMEKCRQMGRSSNIELFFNLNLTKLEDSFIESINDFKYTSINASFDGFDHVNEYIRFPSRWKVVKRNFERLLVRGHKVGVGISPVIQAYNVLDIVPLLDFAERMMVKYNKEILVDFLFCFHPEFLDLPMLPKNIKMEAIRRLEEFKSRSLFYHQTQGRLFFMGNGINSLIHRLKCDLEKEDPQLINDFFDYTKTLDQQRNQSFIDHFPDLSNLFNQAGYNYDHFSAPMSTSMQSDSSNLTC